LDALNLATMQSYSLNVVPLYSHRIESIMKLDKDNFDFGKLRNTFSSTIGVVTACSSDMWRMEIENWIGFGRANEKP